MRKKGVSMNHPSVRDIDLKYHEINRQTGLFYILQNRGLIDRLVTDEEIEHAVQNAPIDTRAYARGELIRRNSVKSADWNEITLSGQREDIVFDDPFMGTREELGKLFSRELSQEQLMAELKERGYVAEKKSYFRNIASKFTGGQSNVTRTKKARRKKQGKLPGFDPGTD